MYSCNVYVFQGYCFYVVDLNGAVCMCVLRTALNTTLSLPSLPLLPSHLNRSRLEELVAEHLDHLFYINDILNLGVARYCSIRHLAAPLPLLSVLPPSSPSSFPLFLFLSSVTLLCSIKLPPLLLPQPQWYPCGPATQWTADPSLCVLTD